MITTSHRLYGSILCHTHPWFAPSYMSSSATAPCRLCPVLIGLHPCCHGTPNPSVKPPAQPAGEKLRPLGSALSPNGIGFSNGAVVSLALMDKILDVDTATRRVRVQVRVQGLYHPHESVLLHLRQDKVHGHQHASDTGLRCAQHVLPNQCTSR